MMSKLHQPMTAVVLRLSSSLCLFCAGPQNNLTLSSPYVSSSISASSSGEKLCSSALNSLNFHRLHTLSTRLTEWWEFRSKCLQTFELVHDHQQQLVKNDTLAIHFSHSVSGSSVVRKNVRNKHPCSSLCVSVPVYGVQNNLISSSSATVSSPTGVNSQIGKPYQ